MITADRLHGVQIAHKAQLDAVYAERDLVLALAARLAVGHPLAYAYRTIDEQAGEGWRNLIIVVISDWFDHSPRQLSWHIRDDELPLFEHLATLPNGWDGHSTEEKYARIRRWVSR